LRFIAFHVIETASLELADVRDGSFDHRQRAGAFSPATHSSIDRTRFPLSSIRGAGAIGETGPHAHDGSSQFERCRFNLAARRGSCTDASFRAVFRYPSLGTIAPRPDEAFFPLTGSSFKLLPARVRSSGGAPGVVPFAVLLPLTGGRVARVRRLNE